MSSSAKPFYLTIDDAKYFASDLDVILAASTICDHVTVKLSEKTHQDILKNKIFAQQFSSFSEFGIHVLITDAPPPTPVIYTQNPSLINMNELVDLAEQSQDGFPDAR